MNFDEAIRLILGSGGVLVVFIIIIVSGFRRYWVWGYQLEDAERRATAWEQRFLSALELSSRATELATKAVAPPGGQTHQ